MSWDFDIESFSALPSSLGMTANGAAPTGWSVSTPVLTGVTSSVNYWSRSGPGNSGDRTVEILVKVSSDPGGSGVNQLFGQWFTIGNNARYVDIGIFANKIRIDDNTSQFDTPTIDMTVFRYIRVTLKGTTLKIYVDNFLLYTRTVVRNSSGDLFAFGQGSGASSGDWQLWVVRVNDSQAIAPSPIMTFDLFNRSNGALGTADSGQAWTSVGGTPLISSNRVAFTANSGHGGVVIDHSTPDGNFGVTVWDSPDGGDQVYGGLTLRYIDINNVYRCYIGYESGSHKLRFDGWVGGTYTGLLINTIISWVSGRQLAVFLKGSDAEVSYGNGITTVSLSGLANVTGTKHGPFGDATAVGGVHSLLVDDWQGSPLILPGRWGIPIA